ncbi:hypothetical protein INR49_004625 [Caranx melampygus]|nr:hypothetical protein INR49_004625 [Caranx melampygus]
MTTPPPPPPPVPKPRSRYLGGSLSSAFSLDKDVTDETTNLQPIFTNAVHQSTDEDVPNLGLDNGVVLPTLAGVTDIIAANIPSLAGIASAIGGSAPSAVPAPSAPPSIDSMANSIATHIPSLAGTASSAASPAATSTHTWSTSAPAANIGAAGLDSIISSLANIPSLTIIMRDGHPTPYIDEPYTPPLPTVEMTGDPGTDVGALLQLVRCFDGGAGITHPLAEGDAEPVSPQTLREENPYVTVLACSGEEEAELSSEEEDTEVSSAPLKANELMEGDPPSSPPTNTNNVPTSPTGCIIPTRPAPPPPHPSSRSQNPGKQVKQKTPRAATIRVSRKKGSSGNSAPRSAVDRFSEVLFHVSSITKVKKLDKGRFSVHFRKKHYDFMAHSDEVQDGWVTSLLDSRGQPSPTSLGMHGQITIKDPRSRVYAALWGQDLWIYPNKEGYQLGIASFSVPLNVATIKSTGKHSFALITPFRSFNVSVDSSKDVSLWLDSLSLSIRSALSSSQVATSLWENAQNKLCADCGLANPEWASVNLLLVICENCAGQHRGLGSKLSKVRSLKMDNKIWTDPLIQLFVTYGNQLANQVWAAAVPAVEQLLPDSSDEERSTFIQDKYSRGRYRRVHALASSPTLMAQRLCEVVCTSDVQETMSLICSGAKFEMVTLSDQLTCAADDKDALLTHLVHILKQQSSCCCWYDHLLRALANHSSAPRQPPAANRSSAHQSLYPVMDVISRGSVPPGIERCISHITAHGLKVEGVYRRCGLATKVSRLAEALVTSPSSAPLESHEQGVLDAASALKQYVRQQQSLIPDIQAWLKAAVISDERSRFKAYRQLLRQLPDDSRATLSALFGHFYAVQVFSQVNKMSAHNLAVVLVPSLFQSVSQDLVKLTREFIIHHTLLFLTPEEEDEEITVL